MEVAGETFYVAQFPEGSHVFASQSDAVEKLRENSDKIDGDAEGVSIVEVDFSDEDWAVMEIPWHQIAIELLKDG